MKTEKLSGMATINRPVKELTITTNSVNKINKKYNYREKCLPVLVIFCLLKKKIQIINNTTCLLKIQKFKALWLAPAIVVPK